MDWNNFTLRQMKKSKLYKNLPKEYNKSQYKKSSELAGVLNKAMLDDNIPKEFKNIDYLNSKKSLYDAQLLKKSEMYSFSNSNSTISSLNSSTTTSPRSLGSSLNYSKSLNNSSEYSSPDQKVKSPKSSNSMNDIPSKRLNSPKTKNKNNSDSIRFVLQNMKLEENIANPTIIKPTNYEYR